MQMKRYFDEGSGDVVFDCKEMGALNIDLNNISLDDKFDENEIFGLAY